MRIFTSLQVPLALSLSAVTLSVVASTVPTFQGFPWRLPDGWWNPPLFLAFAGYGAVAAFTVGAACVASIARPGRLVRSAQPSGDEHETHDQTTSQYGHLAAGLILGVAVLVSGLPHVGAGSGFWQTSKPALETDVPPADGYTFWLDQQPTQSDSGHFVLGYEALFTAAPFDPSVVGWLRSGRVAYTFLVSLVSGIAGLAAGVYGAYVVINLVAWWAASMALYDVATHARRSWWAGLLAGVLTAGGLGFTFVAGAAMSPAAGFAAAALIPWVMWRLGALTPGTSRANDLTTAALAGSAGLLNSLTPTFLLFTLLWRAGRSELHRLVVWAAVALLITVTWGRLLDVVIAGDAAPARVAVALAPLVLLVPCLAMFRLPRRAAEWLVGSTATAAVVIGVLAVALAPQVVDSLISQLLTNLQLPEYAILQRRQAAPLTALSWWTTVDAYRAGGFGEHFPAAFPSLLCALAVVGLIGLPARWARWAGAIIASAAFTAVGMNTLTGNAHPRLMYLAFPGIYLLAASGLMTIGHVIAPRTTDATGGPGTALRRGLAVAVVIALLVVAVAPSYAGLWGDWSYAHRFHYLDDR